MEIRNTLEYAAWKAAVLCRDNYTCQKCGAAYKPTVTKAVPIEGGGIRLERHKGLSIHAHHIKQVALFPELATDIGNGVTLCEHCHYETYKDMKRPGTGDRLCLSFTQKERAAIDSYLLNKGASPSAAFLFAARYVLQEIEAGRLVMSKAGLFPGRQ
jgi:5-methylcytosine-specific restriction endonuclease McrA